MPRKPDHLELERKLEIAIASCSPSPAGIAVGVSGGADSMLLVAALLRMKTPMTVLHLDHRWRGAGSRADAAFVRSWCRDNGVLCRVGNAPFGLPRTEAAARSARWKFFQIQCRRLHISELWLAHHADDRAETFLLQLMRGAGPEGLCGPLPESIRDGLRVVRPLLFFRRAQLRELAAAWNLTWREDPSNDDENHRRNLVRHSLLPRLNEVAGRDIVPLLNRTAEVIADDEQDWSQRLPEVWPDRLETAPLRTRSIAWQRRALRAWLHSRGIGDIDFELVESVRGLLHHIRPARVNLPRGRHCRRRAGQLFVE